MKDLLARVPIQYAGELFSKAVGFASSKNWKKFETQYSSRHSADISRRWVTANYASFSSSPDSNVRERHLIKREYVYNFISV